VLEPSESEYCGSFKNLSPIYTSAKKISVSYSDSNKIIGDIIIQKLNDLKNDLIKKSKRYKQDFLDEFGKVSKTRSETLSSINYHQNLTLAKSKSSSLEITDPWVSERALVNQLEKMLKDENIYQGGMNQLFEDMENFDQHVVNQLQNVFDEYNSSKNKEYNDVKSSLQNISNVVTQLTPNKPFSYFTKKYSITSSDLWTTPRTIDNFVYKISNIHINREGVVYRQGSYFTSNWKPSWLVLTDTGYLHCFNLKNVSKSTIRQYTIHKKNTGEDIFKAGQDTYKNVDKVKTSFSVQLRYPKVTVVDSTITKNNEEQYSFSIIINNSASQVVPSTKNIEGNGNSTNNIINPNNNTSIDNNNDNNNNNTKSKKIKSNKNQVVHQIRVDTSEILEDWLTIINNKLKNIPVDSRPSMSSVLPVEEVYGSSTNLYDGNNKKQGYIPPYTATNPFNDNSNSNSNTNSPVLTNSNSVSSDAYYDDEEENNESQLSNQIYPPIKSISTLIDEVNNVNESIREEESSIPLQNQNNKPLKSVDSVKYYTGNNESSRGNELTQGENEIIVKNLITSDTNNNANIEGQDILKTIDNCVCQTSDMTLNQSAT